ncbi:MULTISPECIES: hypothetical protein [Oscillatoriales]|uniref:hypothetical protein n=1 Tax=Limnospira platensis TaxID=118562 RepID=UPI000F800130
MPNRKSLSKSHCLNPLKLFNDSVLEPGTSTHSRVGTLTLALNVASYGYSWSAILLREARSPRASGGGADYNISPKTEKTGHLWSPVMEKISDEAGGKPALLWLGCHFYGINADFLAAFPPALKLHNSIYFGK